MAGSDRVSDFDARIVSVADLLGEIRLDATADLILWHGPDGRQTATPIARLLAGAGAHLVLGGDENVRPQWSQPLVLRAEGLPGDREIEVVALAATTFAEFVGVSSDRSAS
ncbi:MAG: hypothetical protein ABJH68_15290 [Ilumatobacter sp.]|uniref:hypothetical protein n=1 Tax=Ilumatobacter sp. TaxID=1967498 RepID=UPI00329835F4